MKPKINMIAAMLLFGSIGLFVRNIDLSSSQVALVRGVVGSMTLLAVSMMGRKKFSFSAIRANLLLLIASGAAIGFNWIFLFESYKYTTISIATLSYYFAPVFVLFLSPFLLKERLSVQKIICSAAAVAGMFLIMNVAEGNAGSDPMRGIGYGLAAAALYASVILMNKFMKGMSGMETTLVQLIMASLVLLPYVLVTEKIAWTSLGGRSLVFVLTVGILHTGIGYYLYFSSMQKLSGQTVAALSYIDPVSAIAMSTLFLGETMSLLQLAGGVMILGATFFSDRQKSLRSERKTK
ncbi:DMT family transporter [Anaerolentibacter hominis]|uniref:DMT family transporter n=1 Tax=Anaerolentibacter hominis TaxID=3079009 RepID=UPI0031B866FB